MTRTLTPRRLGLIAPCPVSAGGSASSRRAPRGGGLQLTRAADYAVRALIHLALQPVGVRLSQVEIASAIEAPAPFVGKVMQQLASAALVVSQRGNGGGFALQRPAGETTMLDAVTAVEGPLALNTCLAPDQPCRRASFCPAHHVWRDVQRRVTEVLQSTTIGALAEQSARTTAAAVPAAADPIAHGLDEAGAPHANGLDESRVPDEWTARPRAHPRAGEGLPVRPRGRDVPGTTDRFRGTGECLR